MSALPADRWTAVAEAAQTRWRASQDVADADKAALVALALTSPLGQRATARVLGVTAPTVASWWRRAARNTP